MIWTTGIAIAFTVMITACGGPEKIINPSGADDSSKKDRNPGTTLTSSDRYLDIVGPDGEHLRLDTFPSMYKGNDPVPACKKGESYLGDTCWARLKLSDEGVILLSGHGERRVKSGLTLTESFSLVGKEDDSYHYTPRKTYKCDSEFGGCQSPNLLRHGVTMEGKSKIDVASVDIPLLLQSGLTYRSDGNGLYKFAHSWWVDGSFALKGKTFPLPLRVKDVMEAYGDSVNEMSGSRISVQLDDGGPDVTLWYETETTQHAYVTDDLSPDIEGRRIIEASFSTGLLGATRKIRILLENRK